MPRRSAGHLLLLTGGSIGDNTPQNGANLGKQRQRSRLLFGLLLLLFPASDDAVHGVRYPLVRALQGVSMAWRGKVRQGVAWSRKIFHAEVIAMHYPGILRERFLEGFGGSGEWWDEYPSLQMARRTAGKMWHCTDIIPVAARMEIAEYL